MPRFQSFLIVTASYIASSTMVLVFMLSAAGAGLSIAQESRPAPPSVTPKQPRAQDQQAREQTQQPQPQAQEQEPQEPQSPASNFDKSIFQPVIPTDQLSFLNQFDGVASGELYRDQQFRKLLHSVIPDCMFHYGHDMPLTEAMDDVFPNSPVPVRIRDGRYVTLSSGRGPYLLGRGFLWFDLQDGIALGGFYFRPTNGEPTPALNVFSKQVQVEPLALSQLPPAFVDDMSDWSAEFRVPPVVTSYFITASKRKILLEHDEDYCVPMGGVSAPPENCEQMNANAADMDMDAANYLEQTHHVTNATAWMITGQDQVAWLRLRDSTCGIIPDPLPCRIRITHERVHKIIGWHPPRRHFPTIHR